MNAVEIEEAVSELAHQPFDAEAFPFAFLRAFGRKDVELKRLKASNASDVEGAVLRRDSIHLAVSAPGAAQAALAALRASPKTASNRVKYILATDSEEVLAEECATGDLRSFPLPELDRHFGFFLPLAGISAARQIKDNPIDVKAVGRLNKLYLELLRENPEWAKEAKRPELNRLMARLVFCFFAEDTGIFSGDNLFTASIRQFSEDRAGLTNTDRVLAQLFLAMATPTQHEGKPDGRYRRAAGVKGYADTFPYVNGGLFEDAGEVPRFSRAARNYLLHAGELDWKEINPDIFGSMIQAVAEDEERGALGMHYTSVPNILKVLNPLFLDDLRARLNEAGDNARTLLNLRKRMSRIRVFDPACGSGNFLVIAYKEMRAVEAEINLRRGEPHRRSEIPLTNFRGIELRDFPAEIARLALIIAEYQCDVLYRGQKEALAQFLPLDAENWITCGNALRLDWLSICPPTGTGVKHHADDLFHTPLDQSQIDFENEGGETYICGNPPYRGSQWQSDDQKSDLGSIFDGRTKNWKSLDYVSGWFIKAADYGTRTNSVAAFVSTNSICQGRQVETLWSLILKTGHEIAFAHTSFKWANLASHNAGVTVVIVGISNHIGRARNLFTTSSNGVSMKQVDNINPYLVPAVNVIVQARAAPISELSEMDFGSMPNDGGFLLLDAEEARESIRIHGVGPEFVRPMLGTQEFINGVERRCIWVRDSDYEVAKSNKWLSARFTSVEKKRRLSSRETTSKLGDMPFRFGEVRQTGNEVVMIIAKTSSELREYLPVGIFSPGAIVTEAFAIFDGPLWNMSLIASSLHLAWIATVCGKLETRYRYSNTLGWNTFPVPPLTDKNKADLNRCAEDILLAREAHFPATIADLYDAEEMPTDLREAHERNDEVLERIYIGRRFRNDTERLEKLFDLYTKVIGAQNAATKKKVGRTYDTRK